MRNTLLLSTALLGLAVAAQAQTTPVAPAVTPSPSTPAETMPAKPMRKPIHRMRHAMPAYTDDEIRPGHEPGVGESFPASNKASNVDAGDTRSRIAPRLPTPAGGVNASIPQLLRDAQSALNSRQTGRAQEALERAETAMLDRSVAVDQAGTPSQAPDVMQVEMARKSLAAGDMAGAKRAVSMAMSGAK